MNIRSLGRERQVGLHGMIVNVPINIDKTVNQLPRTFQQTQTIQLQLFRKLSFSKPYLLETIRPNVVLEAALYLSNTELFKQQKVCLSEDWVNSVKGSCTDVNFIVNPGHVIHNIATYMISISKERCQHRQAKVTGGAIHRGAVYGLEIPCIYVSALWTQPGNTLIK